MKLTSKVLFVLALTLLLSSVILFHGCGDNKAVPFGSKITINPTAAALKGIPGDTTENFKVLVTYTDGTPIPKAIIHITSSFAVTNSGVAPLYQFYYYPDGPDRVGGNTRVNSGYDAQTDDYGVYDFSVSVFGPGSTFNDTINVTSGTAVGTATLALTL
jgi:hypothetical protein